jgi:putative ABC transport system permease protein
MSLRSLWRNKVRSGLTIMGIVLAIAAIVALGSFSEGISGLVNEQLKFASGFISVQEAGQSSSTQGPPGMNSKVPIELVDEILQIDGVRDASPGIFAMDPGSSLFIVGVSLDDTEYFSLQNIDFKEGDWPEPDEKGLAIGHALAETAGLRMGDEVVIKGDSYTVAGILEEMGGFMDLGAITSFSAASDTFDFGDWASMIMVEPFDLNDMDRIANEIESLNDDIEASTPGERARQAADTTATISIFTLGIGVIASLVASIGIINTMVMIVLERKKEFGVMKALGAESRVMLTMVIQEAAILGVIGGVIGIGIGVVGSGILNAAYPFPIASISPRLVIISFVYSIMLAVLAALYPAYQAIKLDAVEAMRSE